MKRRQALRVSSANYFVTVTANSRIKVWKLESLSHTKNKIGKLSLELYEPEHLKIHYTSMAVLDDHQNENHSDKHNACLLALGDKAGRIIVFDLVKGHKSLEISHHTKDASKNFKHVQGGHHSRITSIKFDTVLEDANKSSVHILSCSNDKKLCRWDLNGKLLHTMSTGDDVPSCVVSTLYPDSKGKKKRKNKYLMIASNTIHVWNISNKDSAFSVGSFQGHASKVRHLRLTQDNQYLISAGQDRYVYIWKCKPLYRKKADLENKLKSAQYALPLDDDVLCVDIRTVTKVMTDEEMKYLKQLQDSHQSKKKAKGKKDKAIASTKSVYYICAASKSTVYIWCYDPLKEHQLNKGQDTKDTKKKTQSGINLKPVVEISIADEYHTKHSSKSRNDDVAESLSWIQHVRFVNDKQLMILRGNQSMPVMKQVDFVYDDEESPADDAHFINKIVLENVKAAFDTNANVELSESAALAQKTSVVDEHLTVLHVSDVSMANPKSLDQHDLSSEKKANRKRKRSDDDKEEEEQNEADTDAPPQKKQRVDSESMTFQEKLYEIEKRSEEEKNAGQALRIPNADSLYTILTQSLNANDQALFDRLLGMQDDEAMREFEGDLIQNTLDRISGPMAVELLGRLTEKFRVSPRDCISLLRWLLPLLNSHSASFAQNVSSRKHLVSIYQTIDYQIKSLLPAMKLQGRLSLLMNQMQKVNEFTQNNGVSPSKSLSNGLQIARNKPLFVHDEQQEENAEQETNAANNVQPEHENKDTDFIAI